MSHPTKFLITAGPTREPIDPVRYISNRSSGKMGYAIAEAACQAGCEVVLISGPVAIPAPEGVRLVRVNTADEMFDAVHAEINKGLENGGTGGVDIAVLCAAVADFKPVRAAPHKMKKRDGLPHIELEPTRDILASLGKWSLPGASGTADDAAKKPVAKKNPKKKFLLAGFAAETENLEKNALEKLQKKGCDVIVANDVSAANLGFESNENALTLFTPHAAPLVFPRATKRELATRLVNFLREMQQNR